MKRVKQLLCMLFFMLISFFAKAQVIIASKIADPKDTLEIFRLNEEGREIALQNGGKIAAYSYHSKAFQLAREVNYAKGEADALRYLAQLEALSNMEEEKALNYFLEELKIRETIGNQAEIANSYELIGDFFRKNVGSYQQAIGYYSQALILREKNQVNYSLVIHSLNRLAEAYTLVDSTQKALDCYLKITDLYVRAKKYNEAANLSLEIAQTYTKLKDYEKALDLARQSQVYHSKEKNHSKDFSQKYAEYIAVLEKLKKENEKKENWENLRFYVGIVLFSIFMLFIFWLLYKKFGSKSTQ